jgi:beta propeller repeat protein
MTALPPITVGGPPTTITTRIDTANQKSPSISGNRVVFEDDRSGNADVYMLDLDTGIESVVSDDSYRDRFPSVDGEIIAFTSDRLGLDGIVEDE